MTGFENRAFRDLANIKSRELELTGDNAAIEFAEQLRKLVNQIYGYQEKQKSKTEINDPS